MLEIRHVSVDEFFANPDTDQLIEQYAEECAIDGMPKPIVSKGSYHTLERAGMLFPFMAYVDSKLVGFVSLLITVMPHYSAKTATMESLFVSPDHRKGGVGLKIMRHVEQFAASQGAVGFLVSAPAGGRLEKLMPRLNYKHTNTVFFRKLA